jgi:hypothetical protein
LRDTVWIEAGKGSSNNSVVTGFKICPPDRKRGAFLSNSTLSKVAHQYDQEIRYHIGDLVRGNGNTGGEYPKLRYNRWGTNQIDKRLTALTPRFRVNQSERAMEGLEGMEDLNRVKSIVFVLHLHQFTPLWSYLPWVPTYLNVCGRPIHSRFFFHLKIFAKKRISTLRGAKVLARHENARRKCMHQCALKSSTVIRQPTSKNLGIMPHRSEQRLR